MISPTYPMYGCSGLPPEKDAHPHAHILDCLMSSFVQFSTRLLSDSASFCTPNTHPPKQKFAATAKDADTSVGLGLLVVGPVATLTSFELCEHEVAELISGASFPHSS